MTEDSRPLADQARDTIRFIDREINQTKERRTEANRNLAPEVVAAVLVARSNLAIALAVLAHADAVREARPTMTETLSGLRTGRKSHRTTTTPGTGRPTGDPVPLEAEPEEAGTRYYLKHGKLSSEAPQPDRLPPFPPEVFRDQD